jgi:hypothetical protein
MAILRRPNRDAIPDAQHACAKFHRRGEGVGRALRPVFRGALQAALANEAAMGETQRTLMLEE